MKGFIAHCLSDVGRKRENNEDAFLSLELNGSANEAAYLMAVADGMGGHLAGEVASGCVVRVLEQYLSTNPIVDELRLLKGAIAEANRSVYEMSSTNPELQGMGSTCTAMLWTKGRAYIAHVGDSRAYLIRKNEVKRLTKDHTVAELMLDSGIITPEQARARPERSMLFKAIGVNSEVEIDLIPAIETMTDDVFVLCSDGLTEFVEEDEIRDVTVFHPPDEACRILISIANGRGGTDNITVQVGKVLENVKKRSGIFHGLKRLFHA